MDLAYFTGQMEGSTMGLGKMGSNMAEDNTICVQERRR